MTTLRLAANLTLPLDAVTQAIGIVAKRRVGKSYTARRMAEQMLKAGQQVVIVDPKGDWWGIRSSADGRSPGLPVTIIGGEHGDVPLEKTAGEVVAKLVVEERVSVLLDLSQLRKREVAVFMTDFLETLYRLKAKEAASAGIDPSTGTFRNYLSELRTPGVLEDVSKSEVRAADMLFPEGLP